jgi:putative component of membrane protein insertase Oxa1/YidC/SpoIIIJ protein YidD
MLPTKIFMTFFNRLSQLSNFITRSLLIGLRPILGPATCRFYPSCGNFALEQLQTQPFHRAWWKIGKRLLSCW